MALTQDFKEFIQLLNEKSVKYLLVGGYAVGYCLKVADLENLD